MSREAFLSSLRPTVAVLATMNTKGKEARFIAAVLARAGATPWIVDLSLKSHDADDADLAAADVAAAAGASWQTLHERSRQDAAAVMIEGGAKMLLDKFVKGEVSGAIGLGGANGTNLVCSILRALPYLVPKVMISTVAGTAAVQWYVAESDIAMYPSIGDVSLNRITKSVMEDAAMSVAAAVNNRAAQQKSRTKKTPLVAVSSFGGTAACVERVTERLESLGYEVILFHASGVGGKSLERSGGVGRTHGRCRCHHARARRFGRRRCVFRRQYAIDERGSGWLAASGRAGRNRPCQFLGRSCARALPRPRIFPL